MVNKKFLLRLVRRVRRNWKRLFSIFLIISVTTALFVGYFVGTSSVLDSINTFNSRNNLEKGYFISKTAIDKNDHVEQIEYVDILFNKKTLRVFKEREKINKYQVVNGNDLKNTQDILIDENFSAANHYKIGEKISLKGKEFTISGNAISPDYIMTKKSELVLQPNAKTFGVAYISEESFKKNFWEDYQMYYAFEGDVELENIDKLGDIVFAKDTANNSRTKQVIGDASSPQQLSIFVVAIFFLISFVLIALYIFEGKKREEKNIKALSYLGYSYSSIKTHYTLDIMLVINSAWMIGTVIGMSVIKTIMLMNRSIYNYPILSINFKKLTLAIIMSFGLFNLVGIILPRLILSNKSNTRKSKGNFSIQKLSKKIPFSYRYRIIKILRNKKEMILFLLLIVTTGLLINFSFLLKNSVEVYVDDLSKDTKYSYLYEVDSTSSDEKDISDNDEKLNLYGLYDDHSVIQNVYLVENESKYFDIGKDTVVVTAAFAKKYQCRAGDEIILQDQVNTIKYKFKIDRVAANSTSSEIYLNQDLVKPFNKKTYYSENILSKQFYEDQLWYSSYISKDEVVASGKSILSIINTQITMILVISIVIEFALIFSLMKFIYENNIKSIEILKLGGYSIKEIRCIHFGLNNILAITTILVSFVVASFLVRIFLDNIMFTFTNYVEVSQSLDVFIFSNALILSVYFIFLFDFNKKLKK